MWKGSTANHNHRKKSFFFIVQTRKLIRILNYIDINIICSLTYVLQIDFFRLIDSQNKHVIFGVISNLIDNDLQVPALTNFLTLLQLQKGTASRQKKQHTNAVYGYWIRSEILMVIRKFIIIIVFTLKRGFISFKRFETKKRLTNAVRVPSIAVFVFGNAFCIF